ncbi:hypothetical protein [Dipodfec virus UA23Rod_1363]|uniref:Uncharacterized protein n=1 Tax=Dipodfec virus UA23Rod_1363 TaxID=2929331 RepID=A0A976N1W3_9VIRU|nr:hypothetical protein [Dipodfec virus UA23Rod_1363]
MKIRRLQYRGERFPEIGDSESETIPDQALTVRDIISRFTRGQIDIPPIETGESDDIDDAVSYDDIVDAAEDFNRVSSIVSSFNDSSHGQENQGSSEQVASSVDMPSE